MGMIQEVIGELEQESAATRAVLERIPADQFAWKPHEKSFSLGELAFHVASLPGEIAKAATVDELDYADVEPTRMPTSRDELLEIFESSLQSAKENLTKVENDSLGDMWRMTVDGQEVVALPRGGLIRAILLNHLYHHRGQLTVYLRMLDVPLPSVYGPTADENPFQ